MGDLAALTRQALDEVAASPELAALDEVRVRWLGKKGTLTEQLKSLGGLAPAVSLALAERGGVLAGVAWPVAILVVGLIVNLLWVPNRTGAAID